MVALQPIRSDLVRGGCNADALVLDMVNHRRMESSLAFYFRWIGSRCRDAVFLQNYGYQEYRTNPETTGETLYICFPILVELPPGGLYDGAGADYEGLALT